MDKTVKDSNPELIRLNKFVATGGKVSRRNADELISKGLVTVNGKVITELGTKVRKTDKVLLQGKKIYPEKMVYILLNKPKNHITTTTDPQGRKTVLDCITREGDERLYPVGRLDRNTTGVLLITNDGEMSQKLTHPKFGVEKIYKVNLLNPLTSEEADKLLAGIELEDGISALDELSFVEKGDKRVVGVKIHSGKNRIIRRLFEAIGNEVVHLDRVVFAGINKEGIAKGKWRYLESYEIKKLKK